MDVLLLGQNGLLGQDFVRYNNLKKKFQIKTINPSLRWPSEEFKAAVKSTDCKAIINGISSTAYDSEEAMQLTHYELPKWLAANTTTTLVSFSTDLLPAAEKGYQVPERFKYYASAKSACEMALRDMPNVLLIRTSIIGLAGVPSNLIYKLFYQQQSKKIFGHVNSIWSGVTSYQLYQTIDTLLKQNARGIINVATDAISMYDLIKEINDIMQFGKIVQPAVLDVFEDRSFVSDVPLPSIQTQLRQMKELLY